MAPGRRGRIVRRGILIGAVIAASLFMEVTGFLATPPADPGGEEVSYATVHVMVPIVFAICAGVAWSIGPGVVPARLMVAFPLLWIPQSFYPVIEDLGW